MKKIVYYFEEINYVLIHWPENKYTPWVAAWAYNFETDNWAHGHYFTSKEMAMCYIGDVYNNKYSVKSKEEEIKEVEELYQKYAYSYDVFEDDKGIIFADSRKSAEDIIKKEYVGKDVDVYEVGKVYSHISANETYYG